MATSDDRGPEEARPAADLLPALDNLERALTHAEQAGDRGGLAQGVALVRSQLLDVLRRHGVAFQDSPDTYYEAVNARVRGHHEPLEELHKRRILIDGNPEQGEGVLLQIFTQNVIGPIFFEIIQRKGNEGFGEGNFRALFESIEQDQIRRGVI